MRKSAYAFLLTLPLALVSLSSCERKAGETPAALLKDAGAYLTTDLVFEKFANESFEPESLYSYRTKTGEILKIFLFPAKDGDEARELAKSRAMNVASRFQDTQAPYVGKITVKQSCLDLNKVDSAAEDLLDGFRIKYELMASKTFVYGTCSDDTDVYKSQYLLVFCRDKDTLIEARLFYPKDRPRMAAPVVMCGNLE